MTKQEKFLNRQKRLIEFKAIIERYQNLFEADGYTNTPEQQKLAAMLQKIATAEQELQKLGVAPLDSSQESIKESPILSQLKTLYENLLQLQAQVKAAQLGTLLFIPKIFD